MEDVTIEELIRRVGNDVYRAAVEHHEAAENAGLIVGNGHHMAQDMAEKARQLLSERHAQAREAK